MKTNTELLPAGSRVLCAVSGGADSMCLLHLLWSRREELGIRVLAAHYEHGLRGEESLRDAAFVSDWCREREIPCTVEHGDVRAFAAEQGLGIEEAARQLRYDFLERCADELDCDWIATAHNADDNAETLLLNLCRGAGTAGLGGIPPRRGRLVRPLLDCTRQEIEEYLASRGIPHVEDSSNRSDTWSRNRIRLHVMPHLRQINPAFTQAAGRTAALLRQDEDCLSALAEDFLARQEIAAGIETEALLSLHPAIASRVLRMLCPRSLSREQTEAALAFCRGTELGFLDLPGLRLCREKGRLYTDAAEECAMPERLLALPGCLDIPEAGLRVTAEEMNCTQEIYDLFKTLNFKSENICDKVIHCTGPRPGDRLHPAGRGCGKRLKSLFYEAGMTREQRLRCPVFRDEKGILAVYGLAVDERVAARPGDRVLSLRFDRLNEESTEDKLNGEGH